MMILKTFDKTAEKQVQETLLSDGSSSINLELFHRKLKITKFTKKQGDKEINQFHLRISIECRDLNTKQLLYKRALFHKDNASPYIQKYYDVMKHQKNKFKFCIEGQLYRFTLADVMLILQEKNQKMPKQSANYFLKIMLQIYLYLKYLKLPQEIIGYQICPENLAFNQQFRLMLINPCISNLKKKNYNHPDLGYQGIIKDIYQTFKELSQHYISEFSDQWAFLKRVEKRINRREDTDKEDTFIQDFIKDIGDNMNIPSQLFGFMERHIFPSKRINQKSIYITIKQKEDNEKKKFLKEMESVILNPGNES